MALLQERAPSVEGLRALALVPGPWASVIVDLSDRDGQGIAGDRVVHWRGLALQLMDEGAPPELVAVLGAAVLAEPPGPAVLAGFAAVGAPARFFRMPEELRSDDTAYGPLPRLVPSLRWIQDHPAHVLVVTDRTGAEVEVRGGGVTPVWETVLGPDDVIERNAPGGWSQGRYQNRAEDSWRHNAARVAETVTSALRESGARLVVATGDVRAVQLLEERLPTWVRQEVTWRHTTGGRSPDGSQAGRYPHVDEVVRAVVAEQTTALLTRFAEERAPGGTAVEGAAQVLQALARGEVSDLLIVPDALAGRTAWCGPEPTAVLPDDTGGLPEEVVEPDGWGGPALRAPLADVAIRATLGTRGRVRLLPAGLSGASTEGVPAEGIGALCRFR